MCVPRVVVNSKYWREECGGNLIALCEGCWEFQFLDRVLFADCRCFPLLFLCCRSILVVERCLNQIVLSRTVCCVCVCALREAMIRKINYSDI